MSNKPVLISTGFFLFIAIFLAIIIIIPYPQQNLSLSYQSPSWNTHHFFSSILGYTALGESILHSLFWGALNTCVTAFSARLLAVILSFIFTFLALVSTDRLTDLFVILSDTIITIPAILFAVSLLILSDGSIIASIFAIGITEFAFNLKWLLSRTVEYKNRIFIEYSIGSGAGKNHLFFYHHLKTVLVDITRLFQIYLPETFLAVAALEFLGLSGSPLLPSDGLGYQIAANKELIFLKPHAAIFPVIGLVIMMIILYSALHRLKNN